MDEPLPKPIEAFGVTLLTRRDLGAFVVNLPKSSTPEKNDLWLWVADKIMNGTVVEAESAFRFARQVDREARPLVKKKRKR